MKNRNNITCVDSATFLALPSVDTSLALCVSVNKGDFAATVKKLEKLYGADVKILADGKRVGLGELTDNCKELTVDACPDFDKARYNAADAQRIIAMLMKKPGGCPWDSVQTHESIRVNMIEEAYEAVDAIDKGDAEGMIEEFGDVLMQSLLQSAIANRDGEFDFDDVCDGLCKKLISRHTFIFGGDSAGSADDAITLWDKNKAKEKNYTGVKDQLTRLPSEFPALLRCQKAYKKMKKAGEAINLKEELSAALAAEDHAAVIEACVCLLAERGKDAEVELNRIVRERIAGL